MIPPAEPPIIPIVCGLRPALFVVEMFGTTAGTVDGVVLAVALVDEEGLLDVRAGVVEKLEVVVVNACVAVEGTGSVVISGSGVVLSVPNSVVMFDVDG